MPVTSALDAAKAELSRSAATGAPQPSVIFVFFYADEHWNPVWGNWSWLHRSGTPIAEKHSRTGYGFETEKIHTRLLGHQMVPAGR